MIVSDEFLKQCETETFLKFNTRFSTEFARLNNAYVSKKTASILPRCVQIYKMIHQTNLTYIPNPNKLKKCELKQKTGQNKSFFYRYPFLGHPVFNI